MRIYVILTILKDIVHIKYYSRIKVTKNTDLYHEQFFYRPTFLLRIWGSLLSFVSIHVAGFGETGNQQEARKRVLLHSCHNCCFHRHLPGLFDEVIILSVCFLWPYQRQLDFILASYVWGFRKDHPYQMSWSSHFCFVNIGVCEKWWASLSFFLLLISLGESCALLML